MSAYSVGTPVTMTWTGGTRDGVVIGAEFADGLPTGARFVPVEWLDGSRDNVDTRVLSIAREPVRVIGHADVCECCLLVIANGDESGCRDYFGHNHPTADLAGAVPGDEDDSRMTWHEWTCAACGTDMLPGSVARDVAVLSR